MCFSVSGNKFIQWFLKLQGLCWIFYDSPDRNGASGRETGIDTENMAVFATREVTAITATNTGATPLQ